LFFAKR